MEEYLWVSIESVNVDSEGLVAHKERVVFELEAVIEQDADPASIGARQVTSFKWVAAETIQNEMVKGKTREEYTW